MRSGAGFWHSIRKVLFDARTLYGLSGFIMSIVAHEAFHILVHLGHIVKIELLPNFHTIVEVVIDNPGSYNPVTEEAVAYLITILTLFVTVIDVFAIHDSRDRRSSKDILFSKNHEMSQLDNQALIELATRAKII